MKDITKDFGDCYRPVSALLIYEDRDCKTSVYVESYNIDDNGFPINGHPLSSKESRSLVKALDTSGDSRRSYLKPKGLLAENILFINPESGGFALWYTPEQQAGLLFRENLGIPCGMAWIPPLLWKATKESLYVYALQDTGKPTLKSALYDAPFFNLYKDGKVCMGTVKLKFKEDCNLEDFTEQWQYYFFNSYFSHLLQQRSPVKGNVVSLWQSLVCTDTKFPLEVLTKNDITLKDLIL